MKLKKILITLASTAALTTISLEINPINNAKASTYHVNKKHHNKKKHSSNPLKKKYKSLGEWYVHNAKYIEDKYGNSQMANDAQLDLEAGPSSSVAGHAAEPVLDASKMNNKYYRWIWIIRYTNDFDDPSAANGGTADGYEATNAIYKKGMQKIKSEHLQSATYDDGDAHW